MNQGGTREVGNTNIETSSVQKEPSAPRISVRETGLANKTRDFISKTIVIMKRPGAGFNSFNVNQEKPGRLTKRRDGSTVVTRHTEQDATPFWPLIPPSFLPAFLSRRIAANEKGDRSGGRAAGRPQCTPSRIRVPTNFLRVFGMTKGRGLA